jgi:demethylmenaquinone methyltransferase/2-methoxy-6-polyprenyl-1,4-benzoquinol methylase
MKLFATFNDSSKEKSFFIKEIFNDISSNYDITNAMLSLNTYRLWHRRVLRESNLDTGGSLVDFCTGTGELLIKFYKKFKLSRAVGIDISTGMLEIAQKKIDKLDKRYGDIRLYDIPAENTGLDEKFDCATIAFALRNVSNVPAVFLELKRVVKDSGKIVLLELTLPEQKILKTLHKYYLKSVLPVIGYFFSRNRKAYKYLAESIINFPQPTTIAKMLEEAGFMNIKVIRLSMGIATIFTGENTTTDHNIS